MNIKGLLTKYGVDESKLVEAIAEFQAAVDAELTSGNMIPKSRFDTVYREKKELDGKHAELLAEIEVMKQTIESNKQIISQANSYKEKLEAFQKQAYETKAKTWEDKAKSFFVDDPKHKDYERRNGLKSDFFFAKENETLTEEQIDKNLEKFSLLEKLKVIDVTAPPADFEKKPPNPNPNAKPVTDLEWIKAQAQTK